MEISNESLSVMCDTLIEFHRNSFRIRGIGLLKDSFDPPIVEELDNLRKRLDSSHDEEDYLLRATGLHEIVSRNRLEISALVSKARDSDNPKDYLDKANKLMEELAAATYILELADGRR